MDPILAEIYSTVLTSAPYVIVAYAGMWLVMCIYLLSTTFKVKKVEKQLEVLEEAVEERSKGAKA